MAKIILNDFTIEVRETIKELEKKSLNKDFIMVTEYHSDWMNIPDNVILINKLHIVLIREL